MTFLQPQYFNLFFLLLLLAPLWLYHLSTRTRGRRLLGSGRTAARKISSFSSLPRSWIRYVLMNLALASLIVALAHPRIVRHTTAPIFKRTDVIFLLDTSASMGAQDIPPSRLDRAIEVIENFARKKPAEDRLALVSFSGGSLILSYLTRDPDNLLYYLDYLRGDASPRYGTDIGQALRNGLDILRKEAEIDPKTSRYKKVFVLISDGEDHGASLENALRSAREAGVTIHAIGVGTEEGAPIPVGDDNGGFVEDESGELIITRFNEEKLSGIAEQSGGRFYRLFTGQEIDAIFNQIAVQEREIEGFKKVAFHQDLYPNFLFGALAFFVAAILLESRILLWKRAPA